MAQGTGACRSHRRYLCAAQGLASGRHRASRDRREHPKPDAPNKSAVKMPHSAPSAAARRLSPRSILATAWSRPWPRPQALPGLWSVQRVVAWREGGAAAGGRCATPGGIRKTRSASADVILTPGFGEFRRRCAASSATGATPRTFERAVLSACCSRPRSDPAMVQRPSDGGRGEEIVLHTVRGQPGSRGGHG